MKKNFLQIFFSFVCFTTALQAVEDQQNNALVLYSSRNVFDHKYIFTENRPQKKDFVKDSPLYSFNYNYAIYHHNNAYEELREHLEKNPDSNFNIVPSKGAFSGYEVLGLVHGATPEEIVKRYRKLSKKYHADKKKGASDLISKALNAAKEELLGENCGGYFFSGNKKTYVNRFSYTEETFTNDPLKLLQGVNSLLDSDPDKQKFESAYASIDETILAWKNYYKYKAMLTTVFGLPILMFLTNYKSGNENSWAKRIYKRVQNSWTKLKEKHPYLSYIARDLAISIPTGLIASYPLYCFRGLIKVAGLKSRHVVTPLKEWPIEVVQRKTYSHSNTVYFGNSSTTIPVYNYSEPLGYYPKKKAVDFWSKVNLAHRYTLATYLTSLPFGIASFVFFIKAMTDPADIYELRQKEKAKREWLARQQLEEA